MCDYLFIAIVKQMRMKSLFLSETVTFLGTNINQVVFMWTFSPIFDGIMEWHVTKLRWKKNCLQREWIWCQFELLIWFSIVNLWIMMHLRFHWLFFALLNDLFAICSFCEMAMTFLRSGFFSISKIMSTFSSIQGLGRSRIELE